MKDIRILQGNRIAPVMETAFAIYGSRDQKLFETLFPEIVRRLRPKAAFAILDKKFYGILTVGDAVGRFIEKYTSENRQLYAMMADAMADSSLFAFEEQILPIAQKICREEGFGISRRLEPGNNLPIEWQKTAYDAVEAKRTLGIALTNGHMLSPVKSMSLIFELTEDTTRFDMEHNCKNCQKQDCPARSETNLKLEIQGRDAVYCRKGSNLLTVLRENGIHISAACGGNGKCGKCGIYVIEGKLPVTPEDRQVFSSQELALGKRLACRAVIENPLEIAIGSGQEESFAALGGQVGEDMLPKGNINFQKGSFGIAVDIGSTTLAVSLVDLAEGRIIDTHTRINSQRAYGADVVSRIQASINGGKNELMECVKDDLCKEIQALAEEHLSESQNIQVIAIAANTVMMHLLRGYSCEGFLQYPFCPQSLDMEEHKAIELFGDLPKQAKAAETILLGGSSAFIGADIIAGLYACHALEKRETALFLDLGTNGEMALCVGGKIYTASVPAGPAFEGGSITWGTGSVSGAVADAAFHHGTIQIQTIGDAPAVGICGTGVIAVAAELAAAGILDETGKLREPYFKTGFPVTQTQSGDWILFTQKDIRQLQMAKAAVRAGIEMLLCYAEISADEVETAYLAGGFGYYLDVKKAAAIGLLPDKIMGRAKAVGNAALHGVQMYLTLQEKNKMADIIRCVKEVTLANEEKFQEFYYDFMKF